MNTAKYDIEITTVNTTDSAEPIVTTERIALGVGYLAARAKIADALKGKSASAHACCVLAA